MEEEAPYFNSEFLSLTDCKKYGETFTSTKEYGGKDDIWVKRLTL